MTTPTPVGDSTTLDVPLYPRSASVLLGILESNAAVIELQPQYVAIDLDNLRNMLRAHLQKVAQGA